MASWQKLTEQEISAFRQELQQAVQSGDQTRVKQAVGDYYSFIAEKGHWYGNLAFDASQNEGFLGQLANSYMRTVAQNQGIIMTDTMRDRIMANLALADMDARTAAIPLAGGLIGFDEIGNYHYAVLRAEGLPDLGWTASVLEKYFRTGAATFGLAPPDQHGEVMTMRAWELGLQQVNTMGSQARQDFVVWAGTLWNDGVFQDAIQRSPGSALQFFMGMNVLQDSPDSDFGRLASQIFQTGMSAMVRDTVDDCIDAYRAFQVADTAADKLGTGLYYAQQCGEAAAYVKAANVFGLNGSAFAMEELGRQKVMDVPGIMAFFGNITSLNSAPASIGQVILTEPIVLDAWTVPIGSGYAYYRLFQNGYAQAEMRDQNGALTGYVDVVPGKNGIIEKIYLNADRVPLLQEVYDPNTGDTRKYRAETAVDDEGNEKLSWKPIAENGGQTLGDTVKYYGPTVIDALSLIKAIQRGNGNDFIAGGKHDDTILAGGGANIVAFNRQDGRDTILPGVGAANALSLGGGITAGDLAFSRSAQDLVLDAGHNDRITFKDWYGGEANRSFVTLQIVDDDAADRTEAFDFQMLASQFDAARAANPNLSAWSLMNGLLDAHLSGSDNAALGGEIAVHYAEDGALAMSPGAVQEVLRDTRFGTQAQTVGNRLDASVQQFRIG